jgi:hypothetical protein
VGVNFPAKDEERPEYLVEALLSTLATSASSAEAFGVKSGSDIRMLGKSSSMLLD